MRRDDWPERLAALIEERQAIPFAWGKNDCATFAADVALDLTGDDPLHDLRGRWDSEFSAARVLVELGGMRAAVDARLPCVPVAMAHRGDVALVEQGDEQLLGVIVGERVACVSRDGIEYVPRDRAVCAWSIECLN